MGVEEDQETRSDPQSLVDKGLHLDIESTHHALVASERRYRLLVENAYDVIWTMGLDGTITYVSPAVERVRGFTPAEAAAQPLEEINTPESLIKVQQYFDDLTSAIQAGDEPPQFHGRIDYWRKDGSIMEGELQVIPHIDASGGVVEILGVTRDISARIAAEKSSAAAARAESRARLVEDQLRIARELNDTVVRALFAAQFSLGGVLSAEASQVGRSRIAGVIASLDEAIFTLRNAVFNIKRGAD